MGVIRCSTLSCALQDLVVYLRRYVMSEKRKPLTLTEIFARHGIRVVQTPTGLRLGPSKREDMPNFPLHKQPKNND